MNKNVRVMGLAGVIFLLLSTVAYAGITEIVSVDSNGNQGNGASGLPSISANGRYVAFESNASNLVLGDTNGVSDIFVYDRATGIIKQVSVDSNGNQANSDCLCIIGYSVKGSHRPSISADGRYVAFESHASNLVPGDNNKWWGSGDIFVHDLLTGITERVSVDSNGNEAYGRSFYPSISADGRYVTFVSQAWNLAPGSSIYYVNIGTDAGDVFIHDRATGITERVSVDSNGNQANNYSALTSISADGRYIAFWSQASNLVPDDTNAWSDVFVHDRVTRVTERVSIDSNGNQSYAHGFGLSISADGRYAAFVSADTNLMPVYSYNVFNNIFVHDRVTGTTELVSIGSNGNLTNSGCLSPSISANGRYVAFTSQASNLVPEDTNQNWGWGWDTFVYDRMRGKTERVSVDSNGYQAIGFFGSVAPSISADGKYVAFNSDANNLVSGDTNRVSDVFVHQRGPSIPITPAELIAYIQDLINSGQIDPGIGNSLIVKVEAGNTGSLQAFINQVEALSGKKIPPEIAAILIEAANIILGQN